MTRSFESRLENSVKTQFELYSLGRHSPADKFKMSDLPKPSNKRKHSSSSEEESVSQPVGVSALGSSGEYGLPGPVSCGPNDTPQVASKSTSAPSITSISSTGGIPSGELADNINRPQLKPVATIRPFNVVGPSTSNANFDGGMNRNLQVTSSDLHNAATATLDTGNNVDAGPSTSHAGSSSTTQHFFGPTDTGNDSYDSRSTPPTPGDEAAEFLCKKIRDAQPAKPELNFQTDSSNSNSDVSGLATPVDKQLYCNWYRQEAEIERRQGAAEEEDVEEREENENDEGDDDGDGAAEPAP